MIRMVRAVRMTGKPNLLAAMEQTQTALPLSPAVNVTTAGLVPLVKKVFFGLLQNMVMIMDKATIALHIIAGLITGILVTSSGQTSVNGKVIHAAVLRIK